MREYWSARVSRVPEELSSWWFFGGAGGGTIRLAVVIVYVLGIVKTKMYFFMVSDSFV